MEHEDKSFDLEEIKKIIRETSKLMQEFGLTEVEVKEGSRKIVLKRQLFISDSTIVSPIAHPSVEKKGTDENLEVIKSSLPGTIYVAVSPDSKPFVEVGSEVTPQTQVCIIESMKVMNEINAGIAGTIVEILVKNGEAVMYGTPLFKVRLKQ